MLLVSFSRPRPERKRIGPPVDIGPLVRTRAPGDVTTIKYDFGVAVHVFALTGGIGSGKSTVSAHFRGRGLPVVDADELARAIVQPGTPALAEIERAFGKEFLTIDGQLDRKRIAWTVFSDPSARITLEQITHPRIRALAEDRFRELSEKGEPLACYEVPLLFEAGLDSEFAPIVVVTVPEELQIARSTARDNSSEADVRGRLRAQLNLAEKAQRADYVIDNSGSLTQTHCEADRILLAICNEAGVNARRYGLTPEA